MPNQLAKSKRRLSLAEHEAVVAALAAIASREGKTVMDLLRQALRDCLRDRATDPAQVESMRAAVWALAPQMPEAFKTAAQVARFKRAQRDFDQVVLDLGLASPATAQERNSVVPARQPVRLIGFDSTHASIAS